MAVRDPRLEGVYGQPMHDPRAYLRNLLGVVARGAAAGWHEDPKMKRILLLRSGKHRAIRELRDGCIFACLVEQVLGLKLRIASVKDENHDADVFAFWKEPADPEGFERFCPIQLKELPPGYLSATASLDALLLGLKKYNAPDMIVAVYLNRRQRVGTFTVPAGLRLAGLWLFGSMGPDSSRWALIGDLLRPDHSLSELSLKL